MKMEELLDQQSQSRLKTFSNNDSNQDKATAFHYRKLVTVDQDGN